MKIAEERKVVLKKYVSILGDSVSTLSGWNPKGHSVFYEGENCERSGVKGYFDTWWGQLIDYLGAKLLVNDSWSGSRVTKLPNHNQLFPSGISDERINNLGKRWRKPDSIFVLLGDNDWGHGVDLFAQNHNGNERNLYVFRDAYSFMLEKLKRRYPKTQIFCCKLFSTYMPSKPSFIFPKELFGNSIESYNYVINEIAHEQQCEIIDLFANQISIPTIDGSHPNKEGMTVIAKLIARRILDGECSHLDCQSNHQYVDIGGCSLTRVLLCSRCGKMKSLDQQIIPHSFSETPPTEELY